ncbi:MAG: DUF5684 domain-containing protein [Actinomycetota bacterium]
MSVPPILWVVYAAFIALFIAAGWRIFTKAGQPGWAILIPLYNTYVLLKVVGRPGWWLILYLIPCVGVVVLIITSLDLAKSFGKSAGFGVGLALLSPIFYPILAFGSAQYVGPAAAQPQAAV